MENPIQPEKEPMVPVAPPISPEIPLAPKPMESFAPPTEIAPEAPTPNIPPPVTKEAFSPGPEKPKRKLDKKILLILGAIVAGIILVLAIWLGIAYFRAATVEISVNENGFDVLLDQRKIATNVNSPHKIKVKPGKHTIAIVKEDFFSSSENVEVTGTAGKKTLVFSLSAKQTIGKILDKEIFFPAYDKITNSLLYFDKQESGYFINNYNLDTQTETVLTTKPIASIESVSWSPTYKQLIVKTTNSLALQNGLLNYLPEHGEGTKISWLINLERVDLVNISVKNYRPSLVNIAFSPQGDKIGYFFKSAEEKTIASADLDGSNFVRILMLATLEFEPAILWSPDGLNVAIFNPDSQSPGDIFLFSFASRLSTKVTNDGKGNEVGFSPDGKMILYRSNNQLWWAETADSDKTQSLGTDGHVNTSSWLDNERLVVANNNELWKVKISGEKEALDYKKSSLPGNIKNILLGTGILLLVNDQGVFSFSLTE
ncbi:hypothetical protein HYV44_01770 [Candidatus Microgenomates bacterium]|nr:hypothetical protein [Candidatus Microgenomates bacterium]